MKVLCKYQKKAYRSNSKNVNLLSDMFSAMVIVLFKVIVHSSSHLSPSFFNRKEFDPGHSLTEGRGVLA